MDEFEKMIGNLEKLPPEKKKSEVERMKGLCICPDCPTYNVCAGEKRELLYCILGKSPSCIEDELGCICPDCPVAAEADLVNLYYCTQGSEQEMRRSS